MDLAQGDFKSGLLVGTGPEGHYGPIHLKDEMAFQDEIFRPEGENLT